jgi:hypothetical protein
LIFGAGVKRPKYVAAPIPRRVAIHSKVNFVSRRNRDAMQILRASPLRCPVMVLACVKIAYNPCSGPPFGVSLNPGSVSR